MAHSLLWIATLIGVVGLCHGVFATRSTSATTEVRPWPIQAAFAQPFLLSALALPLLVFLVTLPESPPFGAGQGFGRGFLLGSIGALLAAFVITRAFADDQATSTQAALTAPEFIALIAVAIPLLLMRAMILDALLGVALGWVSVSIVLSAGVLQSASSSSVRLALTSGAGFIAALCAVSTLGVYRDFLSPELSRGTWSATAVAFAAGAPLALLLASQLRQSFKSRASFSAEVLGVFILAAILLLLANLLALKVVANPKVSFVVAVGLLVGGLLGWLLREGIAGDESTPNPTGVFIMLGGAIVSFALLHGFGIGLMLLAAWPMAFTLSGSEEVSTSPLNVSVVSLLQVLSFGVILLLQRVFEQRFRTDLRGVAITDYYALLGFLGGAVLPALLSNRLHRTSKESTPSWPRLILVGAIALAAPAVMIIIWGAKVSLALFFGLALSLLIVARGASTLALSGSLFAVAVALALTEWTRHVLPLAELGRAERIRALGVVVIVLLALIIANDLAARFANRKASVANNNLMQLTKPQA